jgi:hypothetical protein
LTPNRDTGAPKRTEISVTQERHSGLKARLGQGSRADDLVAHLLSRELKELRHRRATIENRKVYLGLQVGKPLVSHQGRKGSGPAAIATISAIAFSGWGK